MDHRKLGIGMSDGLVRRINNARHGVIDPVSEIDRIARALTLLVERRGGTSHHINDVVVRLPASIFEEIASSLTAVSTFSQAPTLQGAGQSKARGWEHFTFKGVKFVRGDDDATIRKRAMAFSGLDR